MSAFYFAVVAVAMLGVTQAELECYVADSIMGELESNFSMTASEWVDFYTSRRGLDPTQYKKPSFCQKSHTLYNNKTLKTGEEKATIFFSWGASEPRLTASEVWKCDDNPQSTHGLRLPDSEIVIYNHQCNCCGNKCNGKQMNGQCNQTPQFTKSCKTAGFDTINVDGILPENAQVVPATSSQFCYKLSHYNTTSGQTYYMWGATNLGSGNKCGDARALVAGTSTIKVCTCCGDECNGSTMDSITGSDNNCLGGQVVIKGSASGIAANVFVLAAAIAFAMY